MSNIYNAKRSGVALPVLLVENVILLFDDRLYSNACHSY